MRKNKVIVHGGTSFSTQIIGDEAVFVYSAGWRYEPVILGVLSLKDSFLTLNELWDSYLTYSMLGQTGRAEIFETQNLKEIRKRIKAGYQIEVLPKSNPRFTHLLANLPVVVNFL